MKWWKKILLLFMFLSGFAILMYPAVSNWYHTKLFVLETQSYEQGIVQLNQEELAEEWEKATRYNENLLGDPVHDPFVPGSGMALPDNYMECLNVNGMMGYVSIPKINVRLPIYHGTSEATLRKGVGHIESTALPLGQIGTHPVLTSHTGLPQAKLFTDLDQLVIGDYFYLYILDQEFCYRVEQIKVIEPKEIEELRTYYDHDYVTLLTCTPYGVNSHRLLVRGERCEKPDVIEEAKDTIPIELLIVLLFTLVMILIVLIYIKRTYATKKNSSRS